MNVGPIVSVIVPTYNRSEYLKLAIGSILSQSLVDFEILVSDNCSTDDTSSVVNCFNDNRIIYYKNDINIGAVGNYNKLLRIANGQFIHFFSDDDLMSDINCLSSKVEVLRKYERVGLVYSDVDLIDSSGAVVGENWANSNKQWLQIKQINPLPQKSAFNLLYYGWNFVTMPSVMVRRKLLIENNIEFNNQLRYIVDWNMWLQLSLFCDFYFIDKSLVSYRYHGENETYKLNYNILFKEIFVMKAGLINLYQNESCLFGKHLENLSNDIDNQLAIHGLHSDKKTLLRFVKRNIKKFINI